MYIWQQIRTHVICVPKDCGPTKGKSSISICKYISSKQGQVTFARSLQRVSMIISLDTNLQIRTVTGFSKTSNTVAHKWQRHGLKGRFTFAVKAGCQCTVALPRLEV